MAKSRAGRVDGRMRPRGKLGTGIDKFRASSAAGVGSPGQRATKFQALRLPGPALAAAKWLAVILMVLDHSNKYLLDNAMPWMYAAGRISMPLFALLLGYNLARSAMREPGAYGRLAVRLAIFGSLAELPFVVVNHLVLGWWPLNMLFTFLVAVCCCYLFDHPQGRMKVLGWVVLAWGGGLVEFWWPAVGLVLCAWAYQRMPSTQALTGVVLCLAALWFINGNFWALAAAPVLAVLARFWRWPLPRAKWFFYAFYPTHLAVFWLLML